MYKQSEISKKLINTLPILILNNYAQLLIHSNLSSLNFTMFDIPESFIDSKYICILN